MEAICIIFLFFEPVLHLQLLVILLHLQLIVQCLHDMVRHHDVVTIHHKLVHIRNVNLAIKFVQIMQNPCCQVVVFVKKTTTCTGASAAASLEAGFSEDAAGMKRATARTHGLDGVGHHLDGVRQHLDGVRQHLWQTFVSPESMASDSMARASNEAKQAKKLSERAEEDEGRRACCGS